MNRPTAILPKLRSGISAALERDGYAFLPQWQAGVPSAELVDHYGIVLNFGENPVHQLIPQQSGTPNTYSGLYGLGEFPLHTDMAHWPDPPRYMLLRCLKGQSTVSTTIADIYELIPKVGAVDLARTLVKPRRPLRGQVPLMAVFRAAREGKPMLFRWDDRYIVPASSAGQRGMDAIRTALRGFPVRRVRLRLPGDTLWLDNWRMLHGRSSVPEICADRVIERAYFGVVF